MKKEIKFKQFQMASYKDEQIIVGLAENGRFYTCVMKNDALIKDWKESGVLYQPLLTKTK